MGISEKREEINESAVDKEVALNWESYIKNVKERTKGATKAHKSG